MTACLNTGIKFLQYTVVVFHYFLLFLCQPAARSLFCSLNPDILVRVAQCQETVTCKNFYDMDIFQSNVIF